VLSIKALLSCTEGMRKQLTSNHEPGENDLRTGNDAAQNAERDQDSTNKLSTHPKRLLRRSSAIHLMEERPHKSLRILFASLCAIHRCMNPLISCNLRFLPSNKWKARWSRLCNPLFLIQRLQGRYREAIYCRMRYREAIYCRMRRSNVTTTRYYNSTRS
jgi:hypothetical protein